MSNTSELKPEAQSSRVQIGNLAQQEKELKEKEAERVKGGGGPAGGVNCGEEIPQTGSWGRR